MSIRQRLNPGREATVLMVRHCSDSRYVWNLGLEQRNLWQRHRTQRISCVSQQKELVEAREGSWLGEGSSVVQQGALRDLDRAFQNWWRNPGHFGRPTWRRAGVHEGFVIRDLSVRRVNRRWGEVRVPKGGWVRFRITRQWSDISAASSARVTMDRSGRWHVSLTTRPPAFVRRSTGALVGLDLGIAASVTTSDGHHYRLPALLSPGQVQRKRRLQRKLSRQVTASNRRFRTKLALARLSATEADRRKDWIEKLTTTLVQNHDLIVIENLKVGNMLRSGGARKRGLNRSISNQAWAQLRSRLGDKAVAATSPCEVIAIYPAFTSQRCAACGYTDAKNRESQSAFACRSCGHEANADVNAAQNILAAGLAVTGRGGTPCSKRPDEASTTRELVSA